jgi:hypothetical protein
MYNNKNVVQKIKNSIWGRIALGAMLIGISMSSQASLAGLKLQDSPDISALSLWSTYFETTDVFEATGYASELNYNGFTYQIKDDDSGSDDRYRLSASIDDSGFFTGGTLSIGGTLESNSANTSNDGLPDGYTASSNTLLFGNLTQFGFESGFLYFLFEVKGGDAALLYGGEDSIGAIILGIQNFSGNWSKLSNTLTPADTGLRVAVPEPTSMWLLGSGILGLAGFSRRKKNK